MRRALVPAVILSAALAACGSPAGNTGVEGEAAGAIRLYTSVTQDTVDAVIESFAAQHPDVTVEVFRAPTGELTARIAAERRAGGIQADVLWLSDPLSIQQYDADGLLAEWEPENESAVPAEFRTGTFWGTRILNIVVVHSPDIAEPPVNWSDLADPRFRDAVAIPDPGFAGSAFAALANFALEERFGMDYYRDLAANGAVQVKSPGEVLSGVAEGEFRVGMTLDKVARDAIGKGSPVVLAWPEPGAIAVYSPIGVLSASGNRATAQAFADFVISRPAQEAIAETGWQPVRADVDWPYRGPQMTVDWTRAFDRQQALLDEYRSILGG